MNSLKLDEPTAIGAGVVLLLALILASLAVRWVRSLNVRGDSALTILAAIVGTTFTAEGMWMFFYDTVGLTVFLTAAGFLFFELVQVACALRARRKMRDSEIGHAGAEGIVLWLSAATSGFFSSTHASSWKEALMRLVVPIGVAWLWHQQMGLERHELKLAEKFEGIHWRITPARILAFLRIAEPTARTTQQVAAYRALDALANAVQRARNPLFGWGWPAHRSLRRALSRAVKDASLDTDPDAQRKLTATLAVLGGADTLIDLRPAAPWVSTGTDEARLQRLIDDGTLEPDDRLRTLLGIPSTGQAVPRPGRLPSLFVPLETAPVDPLPGDVLNGDFDGSVDSDRAGQGDDVDVHSTVASTIRSLNDQGVGEEQIAKRLKLTRYRVRQFLGREPRPASTTVNGHALEVRES